MYYILIYSLDSNGVFHSNWLTYVRNIINYSGFSQIWNAQQITKPIWLRKEIIQRLKDQFIQTWLSEVWNSNNCRNYHIFKTTFSFETYLIELSRKDATSLCKFRTGSNKIPIITGKFNNIDRDKRICPLCNSDIGDEFHYIFICTFFETSRNKLIRQYEYFLKGFNCLKMERLFNTTNSKNP